GSQAWRASGLGWRPCWPPCSPGRSSNTGAGGYADRDEITSDNTCIYGGPQAPSRPLQRGRIIGQHDALSGFGHAISRRVASPSWGALSTAPAAAATANSNRRFWVKFKPLVRYGNGITSHLPAALLRSPRSWETMSQRCSPTTRPPRNR